MKDTTLSEFCCVGAQRVKCNAETPRRFSILDFIPLIKSIRLAGINLGRKKKPLRSQVGQELRAISTWPIGKEGYTTFRSYADAAELAGFVLGDSSTGTIGSTGELEKILNSKCSWWLSSLSLRHLISATLVDSTENYTRSWPKIR
jgi:hypothetical protein